MPPLSDDTPSCGFCGGSGVTVMDRGKCQMCAGTGHPIPPAGPEIPRKLARFYEAQGAKREALA